MGSGMKVAAAVTAGLVLASMSHKGAGLSHVAAALTSATAHATTRAPAAGGARGTGQQMAAQAGWTGTQWSCLDDLWTRESGWNAYAANPTSDARGIPQNINGWSSYSPGDVSGQVAWGLSYIRNRYGSPCAAWAHEQNQNWY